MKRKRANLHIFSYLLVILFAISTNTAYAQYENTSGQKKEVEVKKRPKPKKPPKFFAGGIIGASYSDYSSYVELAPIVGYRLTPDFQIGLRLTYIYNERYVYYDSPPYWYKQGFFNHYGAGIFARYIFFKGIFAQIEYELLSLNLAYYNENVSSPQYGDLIYWREPVSSLFLGGGYFQSIGGRGFASIAILFNVLETMGSPYNNPIIRLGFGSSF